MQRLIYRTNASGSLFRLVATINDNTTTTYTDKIGDGAVAAAPGSGLTVTPSSGGQLATGDYRYRLTFLDSRGVETQPSQPVLVTTTAGQKVSLTNIPLGPDGTLARRLYRTDASGKVFRLIATLNDNSTKTFVDTVADGATISPPDVNQPVMTAVPNNAGGQLTAGTYTYRMTFLDSSGIESNSSDPVGITVAAAGSRVTLANLPVGPAGTVGRRIYRTTAGGTTFTLVATLNENTSRTFIDTLGVAIDVSVVANQGGTTAPVIAGAAASDGGIGGAEAAGDFVYRFTFLSATGMESNASAPVMAPGVTANHSVLLTGIPVSPDSTMARRIYRSGPGGGAFTLVATLNDDTTRVFTDRLGLAINPAGATIEGKPTPATGTSATDEGTGLGTIPTGTYNYRLTFVDGGGIESNASTPVSVTVTTANSRVTLSNLPIGPDGTVARRLYRQGPGTTAFTLIATLSDNDRRGYTDTAGGALDVMAVADPQRPAAPNVTVTGAATTAVDNGLAGTLAAGVYTYRITFLSNAGVESNASANVVTPSITDQDGVKLDRIPLGPAGTAARRIYRSGPGGTTYSLVATLLDNTTLTFVDNLGTPVVLTAAADPSRATPATGMVALDGGNGGTLVAGVYSYRVAFINASGVESQPSTNVSVTLTAADHTVTLDQIPIGPDGTQSRRIYRTDANGDTYQLVATLSDNVTPRLIDRDSLQGTDPLVLAAGKSFTASLTANDNVPASGLPGTGTVLFAPANLKLGATTEVQAKASFPLVGTTNLFVISAVQGGVSNNGIAVRFVETTAGQVESVEFLPLEGTNGTLVFAINANAGADHIRGLLNNDPVLKTQFVAAVKQADGITDASADLNKPLNVLVAAITANGQLNTNRVVSSIGGITFAENKANSFQNDIAVKIDSKVGSTSIKTSLSNGQLLITFPVLGFTPTVQQLVDALNANGAVSALFTASVASNTLGTSKAVKTTGTLKPLLPPQPLDVNLVGLVRRNDASSSAVLKFPGANNNLKISSKADGPTLNGVQIRIDGISTPNSIEIVWTPSVAGPGGLLTLRVGPGVTANALRDAINTNRQTKDVFRATLDTESEPANTGTGNVAAAVSLLTGGTSTPMAAASATVVIPGPNNDLQITAKTQGSAFDGTVSFINTGKAVGAELITWDQDQKLLTFDINLATTATSLVAALGRPENAVANGLFTLALTATDTGVANSGAGTVGLDEAILTNGVGNAEWIQFGASTLPHAQITALSYTPAVTIGGVVRGDVLVVGTLGRGTFRLDNASASVTQTSTLDNMQIVGTAGNDQFVLRLSPNRPAPLDPWIEVVNATTNAVVYTVPQAALQSISFDGMGGDDTLFVDSRIRLPEGLTFTGGTGKNRLVIVGVAGDNIVRTPTANPRTGEMLIGGGTASDSTLKVNFSQVDEVLSSLPDSGSDNLLAKFRAGLDSLSTFAGINSLLSDKLAGLPVAGSGVVQVLNGATGTLVTPASDPNDVAAGGPATDAASASSDGRFSNLFSRLFSDGTGGFSLDELGTLAVGNVTALRQKLDDLDSTPGNVQLYQSGSEFLIDMTIDKTVDGVSALDLQALGGSLSLSGNIHLSVDIGLHLIFGVDSQGFFFEPTAAGDHLITLSHIVVDGDVAASADIGVMSATISNATLTFDPSVQINVDLTAPSSVGADGQIRLSDFSSPVSELFQVDIAGNHIHDLVFSADVTIDSVFGDLPTQNFIFTWADVTNPGSLTVGGSGVFYLRQRIHELSNTLQSGLKQFQAEADNLAAQINSEPSLNTELPVVNRTLKSVLDVGAKMNSVVNASSAVVDYLSRFDSATDVLTIGQTTGDFVLSDGTDFVALPANASASQIQAALESFHSIGAGNVKVTAGTGNFQIERSGTLAALPELQTPMIADATLQNGSELRLIVTGTSGAYVLTDGTEYAALQFDATADRIQAALNQFASFQSNPVTVTSVTGEPGTFTIAQGTTTTLSNLQVGDDAKANIALDVISPDYVISVDFQFPTLDGIAATLNTALNNGLADVLGGSPVNIQANIDIDNKELAFDVQMNLSAQTSATLDLGSGFSDLGMTLNGNATVNLAVGLNLDFTVGVDLTNVATSTASHLVPPSSSDFFVEFHKVLATGSVSIPDLNLGVSATAGNTSSGLSIQHGQIHLNAAVDAVISGSGVDGRIPFSELPTIASHVTFTPSAVFDMTLPITGQLVTPSLTLDGTMTVTVHPYDLFSGSPRSYQIFGLPNLQVAEAAQASLDTNSNSDGSHRLTVTGTSGAYILSDGTSYAALPATATATDIQTALGGFASIAGTSKVKVTAVAGTTGSFDIAPQGGLTKLPALQIPASANATVAENKLTVTGTSGAYVLTEGTHFAALPYNATAAAIQTAVSGFTPTPVTATVTVIALSVPPQFDLALSGALTIADFFHANGNFLFSSTEGDLVRSDGKRFTDARYKVVSGSGIDIFAGNALNGDPTTDPNAVGLSLKSVDFSLVLFTDKSVATPVSFTAMKTDGGSASLIGVTGLVMSVKDFHAALNKTSDATHPSLVLDFDPSGTAAGIPITPAIGPAIDFQGESGSQLSVSGSLEMQAFDYVLVTGTFSMSRQGINVDINHDNVTDLQDASLLTFEISNVNVFAGVGGAFTRDSNLNVTGFDTSHATGFVATGGTLGLAMITANRVNAGDTRTYLSLTSKLGTATMLGLPSDIHVSASNIAVEINRASGTLNSTPATPLNWKQTLDLNHDGTFGDTLTLFHGTANSKDVAFVSGFTRVAGELNLTAGNVLEANATFEMVSQTVDVKYNTTTGYLHNAQLLSLNMTLVDPDLVLDNAGNTVSNGPKRGLFVGVPGRLGFGVDSGQLTYAQIKANQDPTMSSTGFDRTYTALIADVQGATLDGLPDGVVIVGKRLDFARNSSTGTDGNSPAALDWTSMIDLQPGSGTFGADPVVVGGNTIGLTAPGTSIGGSLTMDINGYALAAGTFSFSQTGDLTIGDDKTLTTALTSMTVQTISVSNLYLFVGTNGAFTTDAVTGNVNGFDTSNATGFTVSGGSLNLVTATETTGQLRSWTAMAAHVDQMAAHGLPANFGLEAQSLNLRYNGADKTTGSKLDWAGLTGTGATLIGTNFSQVTNTTDISIGGTLYVNVSGFVIALGTFDISKKSGLAINDGTTDLTNASELLIRLSNVSLFV